MTAENILSKYNPDIAQRGFKLREFIFATLPGINEEIDVPANMLAYNYGKGYINVICTIIPSQKGIKLGLNRGSELPDPQGLLVGSGKVHKYVEIKSESDIHSPALAALLDEAMKAHQRRISK